MAHLYDTGYKFLFSHADLVRELLEVFAPPRVADLLDYTTLRPETGSFITPSMKKREDDIVWSIELKGQRMYLYLLLEFQSSIDRGMPVRMMQYVAALYDHLVRSKAIDLAGGRPATGAADRDLQRRYALEAQPGSVRPDPATSAGAVGFSAQAEILAAR